MLATKFHTHTSHRQYEGYSRNKGINFHNTDNVSKVDPKIMKYTICKENIQITEVISIYCVFSYNVIVYFSDPLSAAQLMCNLQVFEFWTW